MKHLLLYVFGMLFLMPACKRGEDDPFFSFRSRKARLEGSWEVKVYQQTFNYGDVLKVRFVPDSGIIYTMSDSTQIIRPYTWSWSFDRDGGYQISTTEEVVIENDSGSTSYKESINESGLWEFTGGNNKPSNSQLLLLTEEISKTRTDQGSNIDLTSIDNPRNGELYNMTRLTNEELVMNYRVTESLPFQQLVETGHIELKKVK